MAKDFYHKIVREALESAGWLITDDPYVVRLVGFNYEIDFGAEKLIAAEREGLKIAVEVKSFLGDSLVYQFHQAMGKFVDYVVGLEEQEPQRTLYLSVPNDVFQKFFTIPIIEKTLARYSVKVITFDPQTKKIVQWIN